MHFMLSSIAGDVKQVGVRLTWRSSYSLFLLSSLLSQPHEAMMEQNNPLDQLLYYKNSFQRATMMNGATDLEDP